MKLNIRPDDVFENCSDSDAVNESPDGQTWYWAFDEDSGILYQFPVSGWYGDYSDCLKTHPQKFL